MDMRGVSVGLYLKTQEQSMKETPAVCTLGEDSQGKGCVKIQKDRKKEKRPGEGEKKGPQKILCQETASGCLQGQQCPWQVWPDQQQQEPGRLVLERSGDHREGGASCVS